MLVKCWVEDKIGRHLNDLLVAAKSARPYRHFLFFDIVHNDPVARIGLRKRHYQVFIIRTE